MAFNIGDVVKLKSGGAPMTITTGSDGAIMHHCVWHNKIDDSYEEKTGFYPAEALIAAEQQGRMTINFVSPRDASDHLDTE